MPTFKFASLAEFIAMDGHGVYVWSCTLIALIILNALVIHPLWLQRGQKQKIRTRLQLQRSQAKRHERTSSPQQVK